jgi:hypothetical protein
VLEHDRRLGVRRGSARAEQVGEGLDGHRGRHVTPQTFEARGPPERAVTTNPTIASALPRPRNGPRIG